MKKYLLIALSLLLVASVAFAQTSLEGSWNIKMSAMGLSGSNTMTFDGATSGNTTQNASVKMAMNFFGVKIDGEVNASVTGTFVLEGTTLTIKWDKSTLKTERKPVVATTGGERNAELEKETTDQLDEMFNEIVKNLDDDEVYTNVRVQGNKLHLTSVGDDGKPETEKYTRVR